MDPSLVIFIVFGVVASFIGGLVASHVVLAFVRKAESAVLDELKQAKALVSAKEQEVKKIL